MPDFVTMLAQEHPAKLVVFGGCGFYGTLLITIGAGAIIYRIGQLFGRFR